MNVATKIIIGLTSVGTIGFVATPLIYQKQIDKTINSQINKYNIKQLKQNDSFTKINREYILTITNAKDIILKLNPKIDSVSLQDLSALLENTQFLIKVNFLKYPIYHKNAITLELISFNKEIEKELTSFEEGKKFLDFIKNKGIQTFIDINNLEISKIKQKDINFKVIYPDNSPFIIQTKNLYIDINKNKITTNISKLFYQTAQRDISINNLKYSKDSKNIFNFSSNIKIDSVKYTSSILGLGIEINNLSQKMKNTNIINSLNIKSELDVNSIKIADNYNSIIINKLKTNYKISKIDLNSLKLLINNPKNDKIANEAISNILAKGFEIKIKPFSIENIELNLRNKVNISKFSLSLQAKEKQNHFKFNLKNTEELLKNFEANLNITTTKENINLLSTINPLIPMYLQSMMVEKNGFVFINLEYKNEHILSKGKVLF